MMRRGVFLFIVVLQLMRVAAPLAAVECRGEATLDFACAMSMVSDSLLAQMHPVQTLLQITKHCTDTRESSPPERKPPISHHSDSAIILTSLNELVKTSMPLSGAGGGMLLLSLITMGMALNMGRRGIVVCRIRHFFARAREGINSSREILCCIRIFPVGLHKISGKFLFVGEWKV